MDTSSGCGGIPARSMGRAVNAVKARGRGDAAPGGRGRAGRQTLSSRCSRSQGLMT